MLIKKIEEGLEFHRKANEAPAAGGTIAPIAAHYYRRTRGVEVRLLKQSTVKIFRIGPFVDSTDGVTAETGLTISQADIQISKAGGAFAETSDASPTTTHDADGWYQCPLTATDTNTLGLLTVQVVESGALMVWADFEVVPANVFDSLISGSDALQVDAVEISGDSAAADNLEAAADGGSVLGGRELCRQIRMRPQQLGHRRLGCACTGDSHTVQVV